MPFNRSCCHWHSTTRKAEQRHERRAIEVKLDSATQKLNGTLPDSMQINEFYRANIRGTFFYMVRDRAYKKKEYYFDSNMEQIPTLKEVIKRADFEGYVLLNWRTSPVRKLNTKYYKQRRAAIKKAKA